jgi:hypothetical protein
MVFAFCYFSLDVEQVLSWRWFLQVILAISTQRSGAEVNLGERAPGTELR